MSQTTGKAQSVSEILEDGFNDVRKANKGSPRTAVEQAAFLGISAGYLSKIRNGRANLTNELANKIAHRLSLNDPNKEASIAQALLEARDESSPPSETIAATDITPDKIIDFFDRLAGRKNLVCVDYRDFPQALKAGPFPETAKEAAEAVFHGLSFAMFQPFGSVEALKKSLQEVLKAFNPTHMASGVRLHYYLLELASRVREVYQEIREEIKNVSEREGKSPLGRLVLYESVRNPPVTVGCGIQSRIFYADYFMHKRHYSEVYEWVAGAEDHYFIRRGHDSLNVDAVREQFHPITTRWMEDMTHVEYPKLPETSEELGKIYKDIERKTKADEPRCWSVWEP